MTDPASSFDAARYKQAQREQWNRDGAAWRRWTPSLERWYGGATRRMLDLAWIQPGQRVLDIAAGAGEPAVSAAGVPSASAAPASLLESSSRPDLPAP